MSPPAVGVRPFFGGCGQALHSEIGGLHPHVVSKYEVNMTSSAKAWLRLSAREVSRDDLTGGSGKQALE